MAGIAEEVARLLKGPNMKKAKLVIEYDPGADAAYIYLAKSHAGVAKETILIDMGGIFAIDLDHAGRLFGIEILDASKVFPLELLRKMRISPEEVKQMRETLREGRNSVPPSETGRPVPP